LKEGNWILEVLGLVKLIEEHIELLIEEGGGPVISGAYFLEARYTSPLGSHLRKGTFKRHTVNL